MVIAPFDFSSYDRILFVQEVHLKFATCLVVAASLMLAPSIARAHCDTLAGPVVSDARVALAMGDVTPVLKWVRTADAEEVRSVFQKALSVRSQGRDARELADRYFFETLVRLHRAGEGAPFTGLKGAALEPPIALADEALQSGSPDKLAKEVLADLDAGLRQRFTAAADARKHADDSVSAGREYVARYVLLMHYIERLHAAGAGEHGAGEAAETH